MQVRSEALPFVLPPLLVAAAAAALNAPSVAAIALLAAAGLGAFFRDPARFCDAPADALVSPADGVVMEIREGPRGLEIAVFLSIFNVHVTRSPVTGRLVSSERHGGSYRAAFRPAARHNARCVMAIDSALGPVHVAMIAGAVARRIHAWVGPTDQLVRGQRIGLIRFGSRAEVVLPPRSAPQVRVGERVRAGETVIARAPKPDPAEGTAAPVVESLASAAS